jgi:hypothetical protein
MQPWNKTIINNLSRFICFWLIFVLLFWWVNSAMTAERNQWKEFNDLPPNTVDVVFMGNSHSFETFQPRIINDLLPINTYLIGISGENIFISYYELREILKSQKPKMVVLETFTIDLTDLLGTGFLFEFTDYNPWDLNRLAVTLKFIPLDMLYTVFPSLRTRVDWNSPAPFFKNLKDSLQFGKKDLDPNLGFIPNNLVITDQEFSTVDQKPDPPMDTSLWLNQIYLEKFIRLCKKNDIQLLFVTSPVLKITGEQHKYYTPFDLTPYLDKNELDLVTLHSTKLSQIHYADLAHLSTIGSVISSLEITQTLAEKLDLPLNQERMDQYRSLIFSGFSLTHQGLEYAIKLNPEDTDASLLYKFTLSENDTKQQIFSSDWQSSSDFRFHLSPIGRYYWYNLDVEIRNPQIDYSITGRFKIDLNKDQNVD